MRRVVTGVDEHGRSFVASTETLDTSGDGLLVWEYRPGDIAEWVRAVGPEAAATWVEPADSGGIKVFVGAFGPDDGRPHPPMPGIDEHGFHTTRTVDIDYIVSGRLVLVLDDDVRVPLEAGDVVIQQATRHAWKNEGTTTAVILGVLHRPEVPAA